MASNNLSGSLGQPQNAVTAIGNIITNSTTAGTMVTAGSMVTAGTMVTLPAQQQATQQMQQPIQQQQQQLQPTQLQPSQLQPTQLQPQTQQQAQSQQQQSVGTSIDTPMEIDSGTQTVVAVGTVQQPNISCSPGPSLGNLQSVVGTGINNAITTASALTTALHNSTSTGAAPLQSSSSIGTQVKSAPANAIPNIALDSQNQILTKPRLQDLVREVDPTEQLDEEVEELLLQLADDFVETTIGSACLLAKHRRAPTIDVKDVQLHLERTWNMWIPGFGTDELRPYKRASVTEAHKQRLALIRKALKKY